MSTYVTLAHAKEHLRVDFTDDDAYIQDLCDLVEVVVLNEIKGSFAGEGTVTTAATTALVGNDSNFTDFIVGETVKVDGETVRTIATITDDTHLTVTAPFTTSENSLTWSVNEGMPLESGVVPRPLYHAMLLMIGHFYMNRESVSVSGLVEIPMSYKMLVAPYKNFTVR
jgi:hypothetical protein